MEQAVELRSTSFAPSSKCTAGFVFSLALLEFLRRRERAPRFAARTPLSVRRICYSFERIVRILEEPSILRQLKKFISNKRYLISCVRYSFSRLSFSLTARGNRRGGMIKDVPQTTLVIDSVSTIQQSCICELSATSQLPRMVLVNSNKFSSSLIRTSFALQCLSTFACCNIVAGDSDGS